MKLRIPRSKRYVLKINYESVVLGIAVVYFLDTVYFVTTNALAASILDIIQAGLLLCLIVLFVNQKMTAQKVFARLTILLVLTMSLLYSGTFPYLKYGLVILAGINCNQKSLYERLTKIYAVCIVLTVTLGITGILPSRIVRRGFSTFGFVHSNVFAQYMLSLLCCYLITHYDNFKLKNYILCLILSTLTWIMTGSRTTFMALCGMVVLTIVCKRYPRIISPPNILYYVLPYLPFLLVVFCYLISLNYDDTIPRLSELNDLLNGRLQLANTLIDTKHPKLWGQRIDITLVENSYLVSIFQFGIIPTLVELGIYAYAVRRSLYEKRHAQTICLIIMTLHGLAEASTFNPFINVALLSALHKTYKPLQNRL